MPAKGGILNTHANSNTLNMKKIFIAILLGFIAQSVLGAPGDLIMKEKEQITAAVENYYIKGLQTRDFSLIRTICIEETKLYSVRSDGTLNTTTLEKWSKRFDPNSPPFKTLEYEILMVDFEGTAAQVKIKFILDNERIIHDYLNMLKIEGEWRIVNIIDY